LHHVGDCSCMISRTRALACALICGLTFHQAQAGEKPVWSLETLLGDAINLDSRTHIQYAQSTPIALNGDYETRGLEAPPHYTVRVARWDRERGWELQLLHHKIYLRNRPPEVEALSVSHGFNIVSLNRAYRVDRWRFRIGVGPVIAHPEARIGGVSYGGPYELAGVAGLGGVDTTLDLSPHFALLAELTATFGYIEVHPHGSDDLTFSVRNPALHAQVGVSYRF
jgi:hypothetical protein